MCLHKPYRRRLSAGHWLQALLGAILCLWAAAGNAQPLSSSANTPWLQPQSAFLPPDEAFRFTAEYDGAAHVLLRWNVAPGYYMYRHGFKVRGEEESVFLALDFPAGEIKTDEYFGTTEVYYRRVALPAALPAGFSGPLRLVVSYQGCAEAGLCYPPENRGVTLTPGRPGLVIEIDSLPRSPVSLAAPDTEGPATEQGRLSQLLLEKSLAISLGVFFLAGVGLALTPCVLPMAPVLSVVIAGAIQSPRHRAALLTLTYVLSMAMVYTAIGILTGLFGSQMNLQAALQSPWTLGLFAALFVFLALSMFDLYQLRLPRRQQNLISGISARQRGGSVKGAALLGLLAALLVTPCISAPLAGALIYISTTEDPLFGGLALFSLSLGMGMPLLLLGVGGSALLPRTGPWMRSIQGLFGVLLLGLAIWTLERVLPDPVILALWSVLAVGSAIYLGVFDFAPGNGWKKLRQAGGVMLLFYGMMLLAGALSGGNDPTRPLAAWSGRTTTESAQGSKDTRTVHGSAQLRSALHAAATAGKPAIVEFYADWCISCKLMQRNVYPHPQVQGLLAGFQWIRVDLTETRAWQRTLLAEYGLFGPPVLLFFDSQGRQMRAWQVQGEMGAEALAFHLSRFLGTDTGRPAEAGWNTGTSAIHEPRTFECDARCKNTLKSTLPAGKGSPGAGRAFVASLWIMVDYNRGTGPAITTRT